MTEEQYPYASPPETQVWQPELTARRPPEPPQLPKLAVILATVVGVLAAGNATMAPVASSLGPSAGIGFIVGVGYFMSVLGSIGAQAVLLTILLVFAPGPLWQRLAWHWGLAVLAFASWCFGFVIAEARWVLSAASFPREELLVMVTGMPLVSLTCQAPMWLFRLYFGWQIERPGGEQPAAEPTAGPQRLSIRDFLIGTILVAVTMALVRLGKPQSMEALEYWTVWTIGSAVATGISLVCVMPIVYFTLATRRVRLGAVGVAAMIVAAASFSSWLLIRFAPGGPTDREKILIATSLAASSAGLLAGGLWIARAYGYRLVRAGQQSPDQWSG